MNKIISLICERINHIGKIPLCNGIAKRAPHIFGYCFPLCYRCTFFILVMIMTLMIYYYRRKRISLSIAIWLLIPMVIDGCLQTFWGIESTNLRRALTGGLFGLGIGSFIAYLYSKIDLYHINNQKEEFQ